MKKQIPLLIEKGFVQESKNMKPKRFLPSRFTFTAAPLIAVILLLGGQLSMATDYTWTGAFSNEWEDIRNWSPQGYPGNNSQDTATLVAPATKTGVRVSGGFFPQIRSLRYAASIPITLTVDDGIEFSVGIVDGNPIENFIVHGDLDFVSTTSNCTTGSGSYFTLDGGIMDFENPGANASNSTIVINGSDVCVNCPGAAIFNNGSSAKNSTLIANGGSVGGGSIFIRQNATGGKARVEVFGNGYLDTSFSNPAGVPVGSLEGDGQVFLGAYKLGIGTNNLSTVFSGVMQDTGGIGTGTGGSLTKLGTGTLTLSGVNLYTGGTTVTAGTLLVNNTSGSGLGTNKVTVTAGTLGGTGIITNAVTIGNGSPPYATLSPGNAGIGTLTLQNKLWLKTDAIYHWEVDSTVATYDSVAAKGVKIENALFELVDVGTGSLSPGTIFTVINNTSTTPISGQFANLLDDSTYTIGTNTYLADYQGGDGNDLTLTVVP